MKKISYSSVFNKRPGHLNLAEGLWSGQDTLLETFYYIVFNKRVGFLRNFHPRHIY